MTMIDTVKLCDWIDTKFITTKESAYDFREKMAVYNTLIDLQAFMNKNLDEQIEENKNGTGVRYRA